MNLNYLICYNEIIPYIVLKLNHLTKITKNLTSKFRFIFVLICLILPGASPSVFGQENVEPLSDFKFTVENSEERVKLSCQEGCAWKTLTFKAEEAQAVNQYGMTSVDEEAPKENSDLANFLFTIKNTTKGVELQGIKGIKGTAWTHLTFGMKGRQSQSVDEMGMTSLE